MSNLKFLLTSDSASQRHFLAWEEVFYALIHRMIPQVWNLKFVLTLHRMKGVVLLGNCGFFLGWGVVFCSLSVVWYFAVYQWFGILQSISNVSKMVVQGSAVSLLFPGLTCDAMLIPNESVLFPIVRWSSRPSWGTPLEKNDWVEAQL